MITRVASLDYACFTRFTGDGDESLYQIAQELEAEEEGVVREAHRMQYAGKKGEQWFYGSAKQGGRTHEMLAAWGDLAHSVGHLVAGAQKRGMRVKVTRLDVQITEATGVAVDLPALGQVLRDQWDNSGPRGGRKPKVAWFDSEDGLHTVYVGSRTSRVFTRLYNKLSEEDVYLRAEWEYKQEAAEAAWDTFRVNGSEGLRRLVAAELNRFPDGARPYLKALEHHRDPAAVRQVLMIEDPADAATMQWIRTSVATCIGRMLKTEHEPEVRKLLEALLSQ